MVILFISILITIVKTTSIVSQDISIQSKCLVNQKKKVKRIESSVQNYSNYIAMYRIILFGDIEINSGPGLSKPKCQICDKTTRGNQKYLFCEYCLEMCHVKSSNHQLNQNALNKAYEWTCPNCVHTALPFYSRRNLDFDSTAADENNHSACKQLSHRDTQELSKILLYRTYKFQSILSPFDDFTVMLKSYEFDIISLIETCLINNQHRLPQHCRL